MGNAVRIAMVAGEASGERKTEVVRFFFTAAAAIASRPQEARLMTFGDGARFDFLFRSSEDGRRALAFVRPHRADADEQTPSGGALERYGRGRPTPVTRASIRRVPALLAA